MSEVVVLDMGDLSILRSRREGEFVVRHAQIGAVFSAASSRPEGSMMWRLDALDMMLAHMRLPLARDASLWVPVGLYNPVTLEVALDPLPRTRAFGDGGRLTFEGPVMEGFLGRDGLELPSRQLLELDPSLDRASVLSASTC